MMELLNPEAVAAFYEKESARIKKEKRNAQKAGYDSGRSGNRHKSAWKEAHFIAWDGEGKDIGEPNEHGDKYQIYNLLANSEGGEIYSEGESGLSSEECLDLLCDYGADFPKSIHVVFGGSYDMNMILRDLPRDIMEQISAADGKDFVTWGRFAIRLVQRKYLSVGRYKSVDRMYKQKPDGSWERDFECKVTLWDVIGFFQASFISAAEGWLGKDYPDLVLIREGKAKRSDFAAETLEYVRKYNQAELRALVKLMEKLHTALGDLGLQLNRWDGAGAVAAAINKKHDVKKWLGEHRKRADDPIQTACQHAYFGGRIEMGKFGYHKGTIYHYDINSAYPSAQRYLPQMLEGTWVHYKAGDMMLRNPSSLPHITCFLVEWDLSNQGLLFGPFPYRSELQHKVLFPEAGINWVWKPEVVAAWEHFKGRGLIIREAWAWHPTTEYYPYSWIDDYYARRQWLVAEQKRTGIIMGEEKVIKLGLNSLYGKTAQRAGYDEKTGRVPPFHNLAYAGYITSETRAKLWAAAMQKQGAIICMATDGIFSTAPLALDCPKEKQLGKWEYQEHAGMILAQSGFYWIDEGKEWRGWSRGFDKVQPGPNYQKEMKAQIKTILDGWKSGKESVYFPCTRFITLKTALSGPDWWARWCWWYSMRTPEGVRGRKLKLFPTGTKRASIGGKPWREMVQTIPEENYTPGEISMRYNIPWITDSDDDAIIEQENAISMEDY